MNTSNSKKQRRKSPIIHVAVILVLILALIAMVIGYYVDMNDKLMSEGRKNLTRTNEAGNLYFLQLIESRMERLRTISAFCDIPDGSGKENWRKVVEEQSTSSVRYGVGDLHGVMHFGNHQAMDISQRDYYKTVMEGKEAISDVLAGGWNGKDSVVLAVPIYRGSQVKGLVCIEYTTLELGKLLNTTQTKNAGASLVFTKEGKVVASYEGMEQFGTIYEMLDTMEYKKQDSVAELKKRVERNESGFMEYYNNDRLRLLYFQDVGINDWKICSLMVMDSQEKVLAQLRETSILVLAGVIVIVSVLLLLCMSLMRNIHKHSREMQMDGLTEALTREACQKQVEKNFHGRKDRKFGACLFLDVDNFKIINDTNGHAAGDKILIQVAEVLNRCTRENDLVSRFGGDEFVLFLYQVKDKRIPEEIAERILKTVRKEANVTLSIGICMIDCEENDVHDILKRVDKALYLAKTRGKNQYAVN